MPLEITIPLLELNSGLVTLASLGPSFISNEDSLVGEIAWNRVLNVTDNRNRLLVRTRFYLGA